MSGIGRIPTTDDPDQDKYPHYYRGDPSAHVHSTLTHAEDIDFDTGIVGIWFHGQQVVVDIEADGGLTSMGISLEISPADARKAARSLLLSAKIAEKGGSR